MPERVDRSSPHSTRRWSTIALLAAAVVVTSLLTGLWVEASPSPEAGPAPHAQAADLSTAVMTDTQVFLPLLRACRLQGVVITAPAQPGTIGLPQQFAAEVLGSPGTVPLTYTWQASGQAPVVHTSDCLTDTVDFVWELTGNKAVTVEVSYGQSSVQASASLDLTTRGMIVFEQKTTDTYQHDLILIHNEHPEVVFRLTDSPDVDEGAPAWSPDGNWIVYATGDLSGGNRSIHKIDLSTREVYTLTNATTDDRWPSWSPDGNRIAFMRNQPNIPAGYFIPDIYVMDADGSNQEQLTTWDYYDEYPAWSPDGQSIAYISDQGYASREVMLMDADGSNKRKVLVTPNLDEVYPTWSPDGLIYYTAYVDRPQKEWLYRLDPDTGAHSRVFDDEINRYIASFAPDGQCFSFYSHLGDIAGPDKEVWKWCEGYAQAINLTDNDVADEYSAWSPVP